MANPTRAITISRATETSMERVENVITRLRVRIELLKLIPESSTEEILQILTRAQEGLEIIQDDLEEAHEIIIRALDNA